MSRGADEEEEVRHLPLNGEPESCSVCPPLLRAVADERIDSFGRTEQREEVPHDVVVDREAISRFGRLWRVVILKADGRETKGKGSASARVTSVLEPSGDSTKVAVRTDLTISGGLSQFGRGMIADVQQRMAYQFAQCLASRIAAIDTAPCRSGGGRDRDPVGSLRSVAGGQASRRHPARTVGALAAQPNASIRRAPGGSSPP